MTLDLQNHAIMPGQNSQKTSNTGALGIKDPLQIKHAHVKNTKV